MSASRPARHRRGATFIKTTTAARWDAGARDRSLPGALRGGQRRDPDRPDRLRRPRHRRGRLNALDGAEGVTLVAMGDVFPDRLAVQPRTTRQEARGASSTCRTSGSSSASTPTRRCSRPTSNYVILATPPGFRPDASRGGDRAPASTSSPRSRSPWTARASARCSRSPRRREAEGPRRSSPARSAATRPATSRR